LPLAVATLFCGASVALVPGAHAQSASPQAPPTKSKDKPVNAADSELRKRLEAAEAVRRSGDPAGVAQANNRLIALALREMGQLRLYEAAYAQAIELYRRSIDFEEVPDTRVDLAIAELQASQLDEAIAESHKALQADSSNARAFGVLGRAWIRKQEYAKAAEALTQSVRLNPDVETFYSLVICLLQTKDAKDKERATAVFDQMVQTTGDSGSLHVLFGRAYRDADDMPAAIREFRRAIALDPRTPHAHYFLGLAQLAVNEWKPTPEVRTEFSKELEYNPRDYLANYMTGFLASGEDRKSVV
jgi:tetratricopeptide (TPR) repeat protein